VSVTLENAANDDYIEGDIASRSLAMAIQLTAVFEKVAEGYIGFIEELPGANTQGDTLEEARANLREAVELVLEANRQAAEEAVDGRVVIREPFALAG
jgi:predicted RNase H-like HicB family nuclease